MQTARNRVAREVNRQAKSLKQDRRTLTSRGLLTDLVPRRERAELSDEAA